MKRTRARVPTSIGICLLLLTGCCGAHLIQGPVWGRVEVADAGADVNARTDDGQTPLSMARKRERAPHRRAEVVALLEQSGASE